MGRFSAVEGEALHRLRAYRLANSEHAIATCVGPWYRSTDWRDG